MILSFFYLVLLLTGIDAKGPAVAAYYESWVDAEADGGKGMSLEDIDTSLLTDLYLAFAVFGFEASKGLTGDFKIAPLNDRDIEILYPKLHRLKKEAQAPLELFLSIGGANFNDPKDPYGMGGKTSRLFSQMVASPASRQEFIQSAVSYAHQHGFDGIDIDWEFPGVTSKGGADSDYENFLIFLKECKEAFHKAAPPIKLSICLPAVMPEGVWPLFANSPQLFYRWASLLTHFVDRVTLMTYNYHTPFGVDKITGANAPLMRDTRDESDLYMAKTLENYVRNGIKKEKVLLGVPLYGWKYQNVQGLTKESAGPGKLFLERPKSGQNLMSYASISGLNSKVHIDPTTETAYTFNLKNGDWISFDNPETVSLKAKLAQHYQCAGVVFWAVNLDERGFPNIKSAVKQLHQGDYGNDQHHR